MPAYFIAFRDEMKNADQYAAYGAKAMATFAGHDSKLIVANGAVTPVEGTPPDGVVIIEFPTVQAAKDWYHSPAYQAIVGERLGATVGRSVIVEGFSPG